MAHNYLQPVHDHFDDVDRFEDVDDDLFLQNKRTGSVPKQRSTNPFEVEDDDDEEITSSPQLPLSAWPMRRSGELSSSEPWTPPTRAWVSYAGQKSAN